MQFLSALSLAVALGPARPNRFHGTNVAINHTRPTNTATVATTRMSTQPRFVLVSFSMLSNHVTCLNEQ